MVSLRSLFPRQQPAPATSAASTATGGFDYKAVAASSDMTVIISGYFMAIKEGKLDVATNLRVAAEIKLREVAPVVFAKLIAFCKDYPHAADKDGVRDELKALLFPLLPAINREVFMDFMRAHQYDLSVLAFAGNPSFLISAKDVKEMSSMRVNDDIKAILRHAGPRIDPNL